MRNRGEQRALHRFLDQRGMTVLPISETISHRALFLMEEEWRLSHAMLMADALIAASAIDHGLPLLTANIKHYDYLPTIKVKKFQP